MALGGGSQKPVIPEDLKGLRSNLSSFLTQNLNTQWSPYPYQMNAAFNPFLGLAGNMLSGMYYAGQPQSLVSSNMNLANLMGMPSAPSPYSPQAFIPSTASSMPQMQTFLPWASGGPPQWNPGGGWTPTSPPQEQGPQIFKIHT